MLDETFIKAILCRTTEVLTLPGDALVTEYNTSGAITNRYVHGPGIDESLLEYSGSTVSIASRRNLYAYANNDPVNLTDSTGMAPEHVMDRRLGIPTSKEMIERRRQKSGARSGFRRNFRDMKTANTIGADKLFHCKANCGATKRGVVVNHFRTL